MLNKRNRHRYEYAKGSPQAKEGMQQRICVILN